MAQINFDATQVQPQDSFSPIPAGSYIVQIEETEIKATKLGTGQMLKYKARVLDGQYTNRVIFGQINIVNQNPEAEKIGQRQLSALCHATGVLKLNDTQQLHNKPIKVKVKIKIDASGKYDDSNEITAFESAGNTSATPSFLAPTSTAASTTTQAPATAGTSMPAPPWAKK